MLSELDGLLNKAIMGSKFDFFGNLERVGVQSIVDGVREKCFPSTHPQPTEKSQVEGGRDGLTRPAGGLPRDHGDKQRDADGQIDSYDKGAPSHSDAEAKALRSDADVNRVDDQAPGEQMRDLMNNLHRTSIFNRSEYASETPVFGDQTWQERMADFLQSDVPYHEPRTSTSFWHGAAEIGKGVYWGLTRAANDIVMGALDLNSRIGYDIEHPISGGWSDIKSVGHWLYDADIAFGSAVNHAIAHPLDTGRSIGSWAQNTGQDFSRLSLEQQVEKVFYGAGALASLAIPLLGEEVAIARAGGMISKAADVAFATPIKGVARSVGLFKGAETLDTVNAIPKHSLKGLTPQQVVQKVNQLGLKTPRDQLLLWSALGRSNSGVVLSQEYAALNGGMTLEMTQGGKWLDQMDLFGANSPFTRAESRQIWEKVSTNMIQQASGQVRSLIGTVHPSSIYRAEQMELLMNKDILGLDELNLKPRYGFGNY